MNKNVSTLSARETAILNFEERWWTVLGRRSKRQAILEDLDVSPTSFYATLDALIDATAAAKSHPLVIARLRRRRTDRRHSTFHGNEPIRRSP